MKIFNHPILPTHFLSAYFRAPVTVKQTPFLIEAAIPLEQQQLCWNESSHLKQQFFCRRIFFSMPSCLERLVISSNYFLVTNTFLNSYFLQVNTFVAQILFQRSFFSRVSSYSEHIVFQSSNFFQTAAFSEEDFF